MATHRAVAIVGPTAAGKTRLCLDLLDELGGELISMDSAQVYRGMDIGTAKPSMEERSLFAHHLIDVRDFDEPYSAADFAHDAATILRNLQSHGRPAVVSGGTMLYWKALSEGLSDLPQADPDIRAEIEASAQERGWSALHRELESLDPKLASRLEPGDAQRIQRGLEVYRQTGMPLSQLQQRRNKTIELTARVMVVHPSTRAELHQRIERRMEAMFDEGFIDEVQHFISHPRFDPNLPSMRSVGYRQVIEGLRHGWTEREMRNRTLFATRQLAKRQVTWLRSMPDTLWIDPGKGSDILAAKAEIARFLDYKL